MPIPKATVQIESNGLGLVEVPVTTVHLAIGCSTQGPLMTPRLVQYQGIIDTYEAGPLCKAAAYPSSRLECPALCVRVPPTARATVYEVRTSNWTGTSVVTASGANPNDSYLIVVKTIVSGTVGTPGITYQLSLDGGETFSTTTALGSATTIVTNGVTISFAAGTFAGDIYILVIPGTQKILAETVVKTGSSAIDLAGTPIDEYEVVFECLRAGTIGASGNLCPTYRFSLDGGRKYSAETRLTGTSIDLADRTGVSSGLTISFTNTETLDAGDLLTAHTTGPEPQLSDILAAIDVVEASNYAAKYNFMHPIGQSLGLASNVNALQAKLQVLENKATYTMAMVDTRSQGVGEPMTEFEADLANESDTMAADKVAVGAGWCRITDPVSGWQLRRCVSWRATERMLARPIQEELSRFNAGAVDDANIFNTQGETVEHDARISSTLHDARYVTLRTRKRREGTYFTKGNIMAPSDSDFKLIPYRRIMNVASGVFQLVAEDQLGEGILANAATGKIQEPDAQKFDRAFQSALEAEVGVGSGGSAPGATAIQARVDRTNVVVGPGAKLKGVVRLQPIGIIDTFEGKIAYTRKIVDQEG